MAETTTQINEVLEKENLLTKALSQEALFKKLIKNCLSATTEKILLITDLGEENKRIAPMLTLAYYEAAIKLNLEPKIILKDKNTSIKDAITNQENSSIIIANVSGKLGRLNNEESTFREYCKKKEHKFTSTTSLSKLGSEEFENVIKSLDIDYDDLTKRQTLLKNLLDNANNIRVKTDKGTDLNIDITNSIAICANGSYNLPGTGGNMPGGEVYLPPRIMGVNGVLIIDGSSRSYKGTIIIKEPIRLCIENSQITKIEGGEEARLLEESLLRAIEKGRDPKEIKVVGEFGIGMNPNAKIIGSTVIDEKTLGTAHIGIGSNNWFGGTIKSPIHLDQVFHNPIIEVDGKLINLGL